MNDLISRQDAIDYIKECAEAAHDNHEWDMEQGYLNAIECIEELPHAQPKDYAELKQEFLRMASYIDMLLECSDEQKETLIGFISRLAEFMPWTERD